MVIAVGRGRGGHGWLLPSVSTIWLHNGMARGAFPAAQPLGGPARRHAALPIPAHTCSYMKGAQI